MIALFLALMFALGCVGGSVAQAGGIDPLLRPQVLQILEQLGITEGGVAAVIVSPATADLNMGSWDINNAANVETNATSALAFEVRDGESNIDVTAPSAGVLRVSGSDLTVEVAGVTSATVAGQVVDYGSADTLALTEAQCKGQIYRLTGSAAQTITIPDAGASIDGTEPGFLVTFVVENTAGVTLDFGTGDTLATSAWTSASGGYVHSSRSGSTITFARTAAATFRELDATGTWRADSTTSAGWAFTPTAWISWTPSGSWTGDADVNPTGLYRQVGDVIESQVKFEITNLGNSFPPSATLTITNWAGGFTPSTTKRLGIRTTNDYDIHYYGTTVDASAGTTKVVEGALNQDGTVYFFHTSITALVNQATPFTYTGAGGVGNAGNDSVVAFASYPVD